MNATYLLNINPEYSAGKLIPEIFNNINVGINESYELDEPEYNTLIFYELLGREFEILAKIKSK